MICQTRGVVLRTIKYSETSVIVNVYTRHAGRQSYLIKGARSKKAKLPMALFQGLTILNFQDVSRTNQALRTMRDVKLEIPLHSIPSDIIKSTIAMFIAELLTKCLRDEEENNLLYDFLEQSISAFDLIENGKSNFHLWFALKLSQYLGFSIENNFSMVDCWFNPKIGAFASSRADMYEAPDRNHSEIISNLLTMQVNEMDRLKLSGELRNEVLACILAYFHIHFDGLGDIQSLQVLSEVFE